MNFPQQPPKKRTPVWVWVVAVFGVLFVLGTIGNAVGGGKKDATPITAAASAAPSAALVAPITSATPPVVPTVAPRSTTSVAPAAPAAAQVAMPSVVCMNLQAAQNAIQAAGVWYSRSTDATGKGRMQISDRNWIVVSQAPAPGVLIGEGDAVLSVVKIGEPNSCS
ncbi:hypothetical protein AB0H76_23030 [Nocardia sp. NPDC050712]|uniref:hypothetical protein n=1 Tax=Nocardia sp. NPDC050712 TaxID=3155518 RepID=UPI003406AE39